jgi:hypothetical protein
MAALKKVHKRRYSFAEKVRKLSKKYLAYGDSTMVEQWTTHREIEGLIPASWTGHQGPVL